jgi:type I restriction enzyme S subunit
MMPLGDVATLQRGYDLPIQDRRPGSVPIFAANGPVGVHEVSKEPGPGVVTGRSGSIGKVHFVDSPFWPLNTSLFVKDFHGNDCRWVYWLLTSMNLARFHEGTGVPTLNRNVVHRAKVGVPPIEEQRRIAALLDKADELRAKRRTTLSALDVLIESAFRDWFPDCVLSPREPLEVAFIEKPIFGSMIPPSANGSWLALRVGNIQNARLNLSDRKYVDLSGKEKERHSVRDGDLLMARAIASLDHLGKCIVAHPGTEQWAFDSHLMRIRLDQSILLPDFLKQWLSTPPGRAAFLGVARRSSVQFNVNTKEIATLAVPIPPIADQSRFVRFLNRTECHRRKAECSLARLTGLFTSLQHRAFRREL